MTDTSPTDKIVAQRTPGPWTTRDTHDHGTEIDSEHHDGRVIATVYPRGKWYLLGEGTDPVQEANANLIATTPDMLAACKAYVDVNDHNGACDCQGFCDTSIAMWAKAHRLALAAIAKAEGREVQP
jgi:hypothetical protein